MKLATSLLLCIIFSIGLFSCKDEIIKQEVAPAVLNPNLPPLQSFQVFGNTSSPFIQLTWVPAPNALQYFIYRSEDGSMFTKIDSTQQPGGYQDRLNLMEGKTYYYKVQYLTIDLQLSPFSNTLSGLLQETYEYAFSFGNFSFAYAVTFDDQDNIYITDRTAGKIRVYDVNHTFVKDILVSPNPSFQRILRGINWSKNGNLLVVNSSGGQVIEVTTSDSIVGLYPVSSSSILREVEVDSNGSMFIADVENRDIVKLSQSGSFINKWQMQQTSSNGSFYPSGLEIVNGQLFSTGVNANSLIEVFDFDGNLNQTVPFPYSSTVIAQDINQNLYAACFTQKVIKSNLLGTTISTIGGDKIKRAISVSVHPSNGNVYISDEEQPSQIHVFTKK